MKTTKAYAVILQSNAPAELLALLGDYLQVAQGQNYVFAVSVEPAGYFLELGLFRKGDKGPWMMQIPVAYVLAIADVSKKLAGPGFLGAE